MKLRQFSYLLGAAVGICGLLTPARGAFMTIDEVVDVYLLASVSAQYRSNILNQENDEEDDLIFFFSPGLEINAGRDSIYRVNLRYTHDLKKYVSNDEFDSASANIDLTASYDPGIVTLTGGFNMRQIQQNTPDATIAADDDLVERFLFDAFINGQYDITPKISLETGGSWDATIYSNGSIDSNQGFSDRHAFSVPLRVLYELTPKYSVGAGYRFRYTQLDDSTFNNGLVTIERSDYIDNSVFGLLRGEVLPKLDVNASLGVQARTALDDDAPNGDDSFGVDSEINAVYQATPKLNLTAGFLADFDASSTGRNTMVYSPSLAASYEITPKIVASGQTFYRLRDFDGVDREDHTFGASLTGGYSLNEYFSFSGSYTLINNNSDGNNRGSDFTSHIFTLTAAVRY